MVYKEEEDKGRGAVYDVTTVAFLHCFGVFLDGFWDGMEIHLLRCLAWKA